MIIIYLLSVSNQEVWIQAIILLRVYNIIKIKITKLCKKKNILIIKVLLRKT